MHSIGLALSLLAAPALADELPAGRAAELAHLVVNDCGSCHGLTLAGGLGPDIRAAALAGRSPEALVETILDGRPGTAMPPWRPLLTEAEAAWIAGYLLEAPR
jgi:cytochrome c55X